MLNRGRAKSKNKYALCVVQRGHVNARDKDIVVKLNKRIVDKLGYSRPYKDRYVIIVDEKKIK